MRLTLGSTVSTLLPLLAGYVRYCPGGSLHFTAYSPKLVQVWHFGKFAAAKECVTRILSLPNVGWDMETEEAPMRKVIASEIVSLDGVVESPQKWHFPYFNDQMAEAIGAAMAASDALLLGRVTYEEFAAFWPSQEPSEENQETTDYMNDTPKFVVSKTLEEPLEWNNSTLIKGDVAEEISKLPEPCLLPLTQSPPARNSRAAAHLLGQHLPGDAAL